MRGCMLTLLCCSHELIFLGTSEGGRGEAAWHRLWNPVQWRGPDLVLDISVRALFEEVHDRYDPVGTDSVAEGRVAVLHEQRVTVDNGGAHKASSRARGNAPRLAGSDRGETAAAFAYCRHRPRCAPVSTTVLAAACEKLWRCAAAPWPPSVQEEGHAR